MNNLFNIKWYLDLDKGGKRKNTTRDIDRKSYTVNTQINDMLINQYRHNKKPFGKNPHTTLNDEEIQDLLEHEILAHRKLNKEYPEFKWLKERLKHVKFNPKYKITFVYELYVGNVYYQAKDMILRQYYFKRGTPLGEFEG